MADTGFGLSLERSQTALHVATAAALSTPRDGEIRDALLARLGAARAQLDGLAHGYSGGALDDEERCDGDGRYGLRL